MQNARRVRTVKREEEEERVGGADYPQEIDCPGLELDAGAPLGVTAELSGAVWRAGWPWSTLIITQVEETRKPLDLLRARVRPNKARPPIIS